MELWCWILVCGRHCFPILCSLPFFCYNSFVLDLKERYSGNWNGFVGCQPLQLFMKNLITKYYVQITANKIVFTKSYDLD